MCVLLFVIADTEKESNGQRTTFQQDKKIGKYRHAEQSFPTEAVV